MISRLSHPYTICLLLLSLFSLTAACSEEVLMPEPYVQIDHPRWSRNAVIYQINTRQFTPEGTFEAAIGQLPRLKKLGVDILWLMPVQEIGKKNRKGQLGSPYSIRDYYSVNSELGNLESLSKFIDNAHDMGMYVILDWVANHTAWDNPMLDSNPEWYQRDWKGDFHSPRWTDWSDVIALDYAQPGLRRYMTDAMKYWVEEVGMDGFRCDVAGFVPVDFWNNVRAELDAIRPVFMLAEWETRDLHAQAFDASYAWTWHDTVHDIAMGKADAGALNGFHYTDENAWPKDAMRLLFTSNHDKNAWDGTQFEAFGPALENAIVLSFVSRGIPMIYNGQEAGNGKRLAFFDKDPIEWQTHPLSDLFQKLIKLRKSNTALWNGRWGADMVQVVNSSPARIFSFVRANDKDKVFAVFNFSTNKQSVSFSGTLYHDVYRDFSSGKELLLGADSKLELEPWSYRVFTRQ
ncbi:MAG: alpha-amylase family glycosyl hydrolase [Lysobacterales bacterium]